MCQRWRRLVCAPELLHQGVAASILHRHVERLQASAPAACAADPSARTRSLCRTPPCAPAPLACIAIAPLQSLRRWLRAHGGALESLDIALSAASGSGASKAAAMELGRCLVVACSGGALRQLRLEWLSRTQLRLGPELAACGTCASMRRLVLTTASGAIHVACPLDCLAALESAAICGARRWDGAASLPTALTSLELDKVSDANGTRLPPQVRRPRPRGA